MDEIKPCPFCGGDGVLKTNHNHTKERYYTAVRCTNCYCQARTFVTSAEPDEQINSKAISAWNTRC